VPPSRRLVNERGPRARRAPLYFQYFNQGQNKLLGLGLYDEQGVRGLTPKQARERADERSRRHRGGIGDLHGYLAAQLRLEAEESLKAQEASRRAQEVVENNTLRHPFIQGYVVGHLERHKKGSAAEVGRTLTKHPRSIL
jgi:hypothetical protein